MSRMMPLMSHLRVVGAAPLHWYGSNDAIGRRLRVLLGTITILDSVSVPTGQWRLLSLKRCGCVGRGAGGEVPGGGWEEAAGWHSVGRAANGAMVAREIIVRTLHLKAHAQRNNFFSRCRKYQMPKTENHILKPILEKNNARPNCTDPYTCESVTLR